MTGFKCSLAEMTHALTGSTSAEMAASAPKICHKTNMMTTMT